MMKNRYLKDRLMRRYGGGRRDERNPYGSRGGYVDSLPPTMPNIHRNDGNQYNDNDYRGYGSRRENHGGSMGSEHFRGYSQHPPMEYYGYGVGMPVYDYNDGNEYRRDRRDMNYDGNDYRDYRSYRDRRDMNYGRQDYGWGSNDYGGSEDVEKKYEKELEHWMEKLKSKSKINIPFEQAIQQAKSMGVRFEEYSELEFYVTMLMLASDYQKTLGNDANIYMKLAKDWLEDDDIAISPSEKLCEYYYAIVKGE